MSLPTVLEKPWGSHMLAFLSQLQWGCNTVLILIRPGSHGHFWSLGYGQLHLLVPQGILPKRCYQKIEECQPALLEKPRSQEIAFNFA